MRESGIQMPKQGSLIKHIEENASENEGEVKKVEKKAKNKTPRNALLELKEVIDEKKEELSKRILVFEKTGDNVEHDQKNNLLIVHCGDWVIAYNTIDLKEVSRNIPYKDIPKDVREKIIELKAQGISELRERERREKTEEFQPA